MSYVSLGQMLATTTRAQTVMCLTAEQIAEAKNFCAYQSVKGLGALPGGDPCELAKLPVCAPTFLALPTASRSTITAQPTATTTRAQAVTCLTAEQILDLQKACMRRLVLGLEPLPGRDPCELAKLPKCAPTLMASPRTAQPTATRTLMPPGCPGGTIPVMAADGTTRCVLDLSSGTREPAAPPSAFVLPGRSKPSVFVLPTEFAVPEAPGKKKMSMATVGLLAAVVLGGGYLVYKKMKKPAPAKMAANRR